jgi:fibronectin-binding autotransporter adhesin
MIIGGSASVIVANANANSFGSGLIDLAGTLRIAQSVDSTLEGPLSGNGTLIKQGTGTLTLANDNNSLLTPVQLDAGTIRAGAANALGAGGVNIASGATLDLNGRGFQALPITVSGAGVGGNGAIVNNGAPQLNALANITLTGNTTFGGSGPWNTDPVLNRGRWDLRGGALDAGLNPFNLTKTGSNQVTLAGVTVDVSLADIDVQRGLLGFEGATTSMGDPTKTLTVRAGATVSFFDTATAWDKRFAVFGNGLTPSLLNWNGANTVAGPVTLNGNCLVGGVPADRGTPVSLTLSGTVDGSGGITKIAADTLILSGTYTYSGDTTVNAGTLSLANSSSLLSPTITVHAGATLDASASVGLGLTLVNNQTLLGNGTLNGNLNAGAGSTVSPGLSLGALHVVGDAVLEGTTVMELDAASDTSDLLQATTFIDFGGTLRLTTIAGSLSAGDSFKLFDALGYGDSFASIVPATPGPGLTWNTSTLNADGTLRVSGPQGPQISLTSLSGGGITFSGSGGNPNETYHVLSSTNVASPVANWTPIRTNTFDPNGNFSVTIPVEPATPQRFFLLRLP